jgi:hypothetical protein
MLQWALAGRRRTLSGSSSSCALLSCRILLRMASATLCGCRTRTFWAVAAMAVGMRVRGRAWSLHHAPAPQQAHSAVVTTGLMSAAAGYHGAELAVRVCIMQTPMMAATRCRASPSGRRTPLGNSKFTSGRRKSLGNSKFTTS